MHKQRYAELRFISLLLVLGKSCVCVLPSHRAQHTHTDCCECTTQCLLYCCVMYDNKNYGPLPVLPHSQFLTLDVADCADDVVVQQVLKDLSLLSLQTPTHKWTHR